MELDRRQKAIFVVWVVLLLFVLPGISYLLARLLGG
jgi:hypothetical protein